MTSWLSTESSSSPWCNVRGNPSMIQLYSVSRDWTLYLTLPCNLSSSALTISSMSSSDTRPGMSIEVFHRDVKSGHIPPPATTASAFRPTSLLAMISFLNTSPVETKATSYCSTSLSMSITRPTKIVPRRTSQTESPKNVSPNKPYVYTRRTFPLPGFPNINILNPSSCTPSNCSACDVESLTA